MEAFFYLVSGCVGLFLLAVIAFPRYFVPAEVTKTKTVGPTYWGSYPGQPSEDAPEEKKIKVRATKKRELVNYGSSLYAQGKGVRMSGRG